MKKTKSSLTVVSALFLLMFVPLVSWGAENWAYHKKKDMAFSVYKTVDNQKWHVYIVLQVRPNEVLFSALIPFSEYQKYFTFNLPTQLKYQGKNLVRHELFFWGEDNSPVEIQIDGQNIPGFIRRSGHQARYEGGSIDSLIDALKKGKTLKVDKHYWDEHNKKSYSTFSLVGFNKAFSKVSSNTVPMSKKFSLSGLRCKNKGPRKIVWLNTPHGSYALNGQAISWAKRAANSGYPITGSDGLPMKIGRDYIPAEQLHDLIQEGLKRCR